MRYWTAFAFIFLIATAIPGFARADYARGLRAAENGNYAMALHEFREAAEQGDAKAQFKLGVMYKRGYGVVQDNSAAVKWFRVAAEQGDVKAQFNFGQMFRKGDGVERDYVEAANSPLKKASLTGFHATAKHIAAKAVSPSSETMRTI